MNPNNINENTKVRFWDKVKILTQDDCWEWQFSKSPKGYGRFQINGHNRLSHRIAYSISKDIDLVDKSIHIRHKCDNPPCCNPDHLEQGSNQDNVNDKMERGRHFYQNQETCKRGHLLDGTQHGGRWRMCKICQNESLKRYRDRKKQNEK